MKKKQYEKVKNSYVNMGIGFEFLGIFGIPALTGYWLDVYFEIKDHWLLFLGMFLGFFYGIWYMYRRGREMEEDQEMNRGDSAKRDLPLDKIAEDIEKKMNSIGDKIDSLERRNSKRKKD